jgi:hypothetical protein
VSSCPRLCALANPGLPGFARFWGRDISRFADLSRTTGNPAYGRIHLGKFPAGNFGFGVSASGTPEAPALAIGGSGLPLGFLQETFSLERLEHDCRMPPDVIAGGIAMPSTQ